MTMSPLAFILCLLAFGGAAAALSHILGIARGIEAERKVNKRAPPPSEPEPDESLTDADLLAIGATVTVRSPK